MLYTYMVGGRQGRSRRSRSSHSQITLKAERFGSHNTNTPLHTSYTHTSPLNTIQASSLVRCSLTSLKEMSSLKGCPPSPLRLGFCFVSLIHSIWLKPFPGFDCIHTQHPV